MAMTDNEQRDLRSYCAFILKEYGFDIPPNDPVIPALYIIHKEMQLNNESNKVIASKFKEGTSKMHQTVFNFSSGEAALKFQMGITIKWIAMGGLILTFVLVAVWYWSMVKNVNKAEAIIKTSGEMGELMKLIKKGRDDYYFIDFTEARGDSIQRFRQFQKLDAQTVRVYVRKGSK